MKKKKQEKTIKISNEKGGVDGDIIWMKGMEDIINLSIDDNNQDEDKDKKKNINKSSNIKI
jgi:hypothetical protein